MHIIRFEAQNIQRLQAVTIEPSADSPAVVLAGGNEEGKSSCLDAIEMALAGERVMPPEPIRRGQETAHVVVDLGDMVVTRRYTAKGSSLTVTNREGLKYPSPQSLLDGLYNKLTFEPLEFAWLSETKDGRTKQAEILRTLAGVDTSDLEKERAMVYATRTEVNRDLTKAKAVLDKAPWFEGFAEPQDAADILAQLADADRLANVVAEAANQVFQSRAIRASAEERVKRADVALEAARRALELAETEATAARTHLNSMNAEVEKRVEEHAGASSAVPDTAELRDRLAGVQEHNRKVDANKRRAELAAEVAALQTKSDEHTQRIEAIDEQKADRLDAAEFPLEGLGLDDNGVTWNGLPFEQASTAIRTRVSVAIGFALHPKLKVLLVRNGNDLDAKNLKLLADAAAEVGGQVWIERIAGGEGLQTVVIEDGTVKGAEPVPEQVESPTATSPLQRLVGDDLRTHEEVDGSAPESKGPSPEPKLRTRARKPGNAPGLFKGGEK